MDLIRDLAELPRAPTIAVIINCSTKWVTSLALSSALRHIDCPVLIIDCESTDHSRWHFQELSNRYSLPFYWIEWPLRPHPTTLDRLFRSVQSEAVLLIDSDIEIRSARVVSAMMDALQQHADAYGAGFVQGPEWLGKQHGLREHTGYYEERMWIPLVLLRTAAIKSLLEQGYGFANRRSYFDFPAWPRVSRLLAYRYRVRGLRRLPIRFTRAGMGEPEYDGRNPAFVEYDTGADLHAKLKSSGYSFFQLSPELWGEVEHYHGVTRAQLTGPLRRLAKSMRLASRDTETDQRAIIASVMQRLAWVYGISHSHHR